MGWTEGGRGSEVGEGGVVAAWGGGVVGEVWAGVRQYSDFEI